MKARKRLTTSLAGAAAFAALALVPVAAPAAPCQRLAATPWGDAYAATNCDKPGVTPAKRCDVYVRIPGPPPAGTRGLEICDQ